MHQRKHNIAIYIHWPFCKSKCPYCDFNSHVRESIDIKNWNSAYLLEIEKHKEYLKDKNITSIFFGGGTPSLMPSFITQNIIQELAKFASIDPHIEITLEANPTSVESGKFKEFAKSGINRVSLGIQSLDLDNLKFLGREHSANEAIEAIKIARDNFARYSFDLIYALPNQTIKTWENELNTALKLADKHLSLYQLTIEKGTPFYRMHLQKKFQIPDDNLAREFYCTTQAIMNDHGLPAYEISNHAKPNEECKHNMIYWQYGDFLGIGPGAHSRTNYQAFHSIYHPENWLNAALTRQNTIQNESKLTLEEQIQEMLLMGLRLTKGIDERIFLKKIGKNLFDCINKQQLSILIDNNFIQFNNHHLYATQEGKLVLNHILDKLINI